MRGLEDALDRGDADAERSEVIAPLASRRAAVAREEVSTEEGAGAQAWADDRVARAFSPGEGQVAYVDTAKTTAMAAVAASAPR